MKILYATDGTAPAIAAGRLIEKLARRDSNEFTIVTVAEPEVLVPPMLDAAPEATHRDGLRRARAVAKGAAQSLTDEGFLTNVEVLRGLPADEILRLIGRGGYELTVMGAGTKTRLGHLLLGSVSTHVLHRSPTSTLIVHEQPTEGSPARILVGADGSPGAAHALSRLIALCDPERCTIAVMAVARAFLPLQVEPFVPLLTPEGPAEVRATTAALHRAWGHSERAGRALRRAGFKTEAYASVGHPASTLLRDARSSGADLVVVGSRGLSALRGSIAGSVSAHIARAARAALVARPATHIVGDLPSPTREEART